MLKKVEAKCKRCGKEFWRQRTAQDYCSAQCRKAAWSDTKKRRLMPSRREILGSVQNGPFSPTKTSTCKPPHTPNLGAFVRAQVVALRMAIIVVGRNDPVRDVDDALGAVKGLRLRICVEDEKELQILGCGWRIVTCQFRSNKVFLHDNGNVATKKRKAFKELSKGLF